MPIKLRTKQNSSTYLGKGWKAPTFRLWEKDLSSPPFFFFPFFFPLHFFPLRNDKQTCSKFKAAPLECALGNCLHVPEKYPAWFFLPFRRSPPIQFPCRSEKRPSKARATDSVWSLSTSGRGKSEAAAAQPRDASRAARVILHVWKEEERREGVGGVGWGREISACKFHHMAV